MENNLSSLVEKFLIREQIDVEQVTNKVDCKIYSIATVNRIAHEFGMYQQAQERIVSVGDIIGFEDDFQTLFQGRAENIFEELNYLFGEGEAEYQNRSVSMLDYSGDEMLANLRQSFEEQPIIVKETGEGSYSIAGNGKHRYAILRALYLSELAKVEDSPEKIEKLKNKYRIPVKVENLDSLKTYSKYLLMTYGINSIESVEFDKNSNRERTGHTIVETTDKGIFGGNVVLLLNDADLIEYVRSMIQKNRDVTKREYEGTKEPNTVVDRKKMKWIKKMEILKNLPEFYRTIKSFKDFFDTNLIDLYLDNNIDVNKIEQL